LHPAAGAPETAIEVLRLPLQIPWRAWFETRLKFAGSAMQPETMPKALVPSKMHRFVIRRVTSVSNCFGKPVLGAFPEHGAVRNAHRIYVRMIEKLY
jgi:hypothetical protein